MRLNNIVSNPAILMGKPTIKGTRISVDLILTMLSQGVSINEILEEYPDLKKEDVLAAISYAKDTVAGEEIRQLEMHA
jgi:uncharacterized protein (DUF433 family)